MQYRMAIESNDVYSFLREAVQGQLYNNLRERAHKTNYLSKEQSNYIDHE